MFFERANSSSPEHKESAKPLPLGHDARSPPLGQLFSEILEKGGDGQVWN